MADKLKIHVVTPERTVLNLDAESVSIPTSEGQLTILPNHVSLISTLISGELSVKDRSDISVLHIAGGFVQVKNNEVVILADVAEHIHEIDIKRAQEAITRARESLENKSIDFNEKFIIANSLKRNINRISIYSKHHRNRNIPTVDNAILKN